MATPRLDKYINYIIKLKVFSENKFEKPIIF